MRRDSAFTRGWTCLVIRSIASEVIGFGTVTNRPSVVWARIGAAERNSQARTANGRDNRRRAMIDIGARSLGVGSGVSATPPADYNAAANGGKTPFRRSAPISL